MASEQPYNLPRIFEVQDPSTNQHVVMVLMSTNLASKYPSKPWGTAITEIGLAKKDADLFPDYVLVDFEPVKGSSDLFWIFQKLSGPEWSTTAKEKQNLTPQKFRSFVDVVTTEQEVDPATAPTTLTGSMVSSSVKQLPNTGKAVLTEVTETITEVATPLISHSVEDQDYVTTETLVAEGAAADTGAGVVTSQVVALGNGKAVKTTKIAVASFTSPDTWTVGYATMADRTDGDQGVIPAKFRSLSTLQVWRFKVDAAAAPTTPALGTGSGDYTGYTLIERVVKQVRSDGSEDVWEVVVVGLAGTTSSLVSYVVGEGAERVTVTEALLSAVPAPLPTDTATDKYELTALGNGMYIQVLRSQAVFAGTTNSHEQPTNVPREFLTITAQETTSALEAGTSTTPEALGSDGLGIVSASVKRADKFTIQRQKTTLTGTKADTVEELLTDGDKLLVTRTKTHGAAVSDVPSALVTVQTRALGDGLYESVVDEVPSVFDGKQVTLSIPDVIPARFQAAEAVSSTQETLAGTTADPVLASDEESRSEQRIDAFRIRRVSKKKSVTTLPVTLDLGRQIDQDGVVSTINETLDEGAQTITPSATVSGEVTDIGNGMTVKTEVTKAEVFAAASYSKESPDPVPTKFRVAAPTSTTQTTTAGTASMPSSLGVGEIAKSESQQTKFVKRTQTTTRAAVTLPVSLVQTGTSRDGLVTTITETLQSGDTIEEPTATTTVDSDAVGDGTYVVRKVETPVFSEETFSAEKPEVVPAAFRAAVPQLSTSEVVAGIAEEPTLVDGDKSASQQQINAFLKKVTRTSRDLGVLPVTLTETTVDQVGVVETTDKTLSDVAQTITPSATVTGQVEELGDGLTLKTLTTKAEVFSAASFSKEIADTTPQKFRSAVETVTTEAIEAGTAAEPTLASGDLAKSEDQQTKFTKRVRATTRSVASLPVSLTLGRRVDQDGIVETISENLDAGGQTITPSATVTGEVEDLGNGQTVKTTVTKASVFPATTYSQEQTIPVPREFLTITGEVTEQTTEAGTTATPDSLGTDGTGIISASAQRVDAFKIRKSKTTRTATKASSIVEKLTEGDKSVITRTRTLGAATSTTPTALINVQTKALGDGVYENVVDTIPAVFDSKQVSIEKPDLVPAKFRGDVPTETTQEIVAATSVSMPSLASDEVAKSEQRLTAFTKRTAITNRDVTVLPVSLTESLVDNDGVIVTRIQTLDDAIQTITPTATVSGQVEALGDSLTLKIEDTKAEVFDAKTVSIDRQDLIPSKFRRESPTETTQEIVAATSVSMPTLGPTDVSASEQRVSAFTKRTSVTTRDAAALPISLTDTLVDPDGIVITRVQTLDDTAQTITPTATVSGQVENLGDGLTVLTEDTKASVFPATTYAHEQTSTVPREFLTITGEVTEQSVIAGTSTTPDTLGTDGTGIVNASVQRVDAFKIKKSKTTRTASKGSSLVEKRTDEDKLVVTRTKTHGTATAEVPSATQSVTTEAVGDGLFVSVVDSVPSVFPASVSTHEQTPTVPREFLTITAKESTSAIAAGTSATPTALGTDGLGVVDASAKRIDAFRVQTQETTVTGTKAGSLTEKLTDNSKLVVTRTKTHGTATSDVPTALKSVKIEALGDGQFLNVIDEVPSVFPSTTESHEQQSTIPREFLTISTETTTQSTTSGTSTTPATLGSNGLGVVTASVQRLDAFTIRSQSTTRTGSVASTITEKLTDNDKQVVTRAKTYGTTTAEVPSATKTIRSEAVGNGDFVNVVDTIPAVFPGTVVAHEQPVSIPTKFISAETTTTTTAAGPLATPEALGTLGAGVVAASAQRVDAFTVKTQKTERTISGTALAGEQAYDQRQVASTSEQVVADGTSADSGLLILSSNVTPLGNGKSILETSSVAAWVEHKEVDWNNDFQGHIERTEQFVDPSEADTPVDYASYKIINEDRSLKIAEVVPTAALNDYVLSFPKKLSLDLPRVLKSVAIVWNESSDTGQRFNAFSNSQTGNSWTLSGSNADAANSSVGLTPDIQLVFEDYSANNLFCTVYAFFLPMPVTEVSLLAKLTTLAAAAVTKWPVFKTKSHTISLRGQTGAVSVQTDASNGVVVQNTVATGLHRQEGYSDDIRKNLTNGSVVIPPCLHGALSFTGMASRTATVAATATSPIYSTYTAPITVTHARSITVTASVSPSSLTATSPSAIPITGLYLVDASVQPYEYGYAKVYAEVFDATSLA